MKRHRYNIFAKKKNVGETLSNENNDTIPEIHQEVINIHLFFRE